MRSLYRAGSSPLHRMPAGAKLAGLAVCALVLSLHPHDPVSIAIALGAVATLYALARMPVRVLAAQLWQLRWMILVLGGLLFVFTSPQNALISTGRVVALVLLAGLLTLTTTMGALLDVLHRMLRPLRRVGIDADAVAMTVSLTITMIPVVAGFAGRVREAQQARGVRLGIRSAVPLFVMALRHADDVGDALAARGLV
ncbi:energy-coupling factor transporter transmembrane protein EcfT [Microbacterium sp. CIAB417]|uniref:energy-coupling factor transporter transmembrane component T family protein n=1 Tax=Microbacterium sp. CIAB417 TaxID=2860287 RepID=UPI001FAC0F61|nr:energy-coupling factor transporter transmembrane protein EcfT [Microbacterium sp. CIAB417]